MVSRKNADFDPGKSRKTRVSFLLNDDDDEDAVLGNTGFEVLRQGTNSNKERKGEFGRQDRTAHQAGEESVQAISKGGALLPTRSSGAVSASGSMQSASFYQGSPSQEQQPGGSGKKGVRKKRQRKFPCDTCGFSFYTNSDLQKVRYCALAYHLQN